MIAAIQKSVLYEAASIKDSGPMPILTSRPLSISLRVLAFSLSAKATYLALNSMACSANNFAFLLAVKAITSNIPLNELRTISKVLCPIEPVDPNIVTRFVILFYIGQTSGAM